MLSINCIMLFITFSSPLLCRMLKVLVTCVNTVVHHESLTLLYNCTEKYYLIFHCQTQRNIAGRITDNRKNVNKVNMFLNDSFVDDRREALLYRGKGIKSLIWAIRRGHAEDNRTAFDSIYFV